MTALLWIAFGMATGATVLYGALGLRRPLDRTYLSFACIMAFLAAYLYFEWELYQALTSEAAVEAMRRQVVVADAFLAGVLVFVPAYTRSRIPGWLKSAFWGGLVLLFVANLWAPYGAWFATEPELVRSKFLGETYTVAVAGTLSALQYVHVLYVVSLFVLAFGCALGAIRRRQRQRGATLALALIVVVALHIVDVVRDAIGGVWPYMAEFGVATWGIIMSIQMAFDFRMNQQRLHAALGQAEEDAAELARLVDASLVVRDRLNTPLQTLELGLEMCTARRPEEKEALAELRRAVAQVARLGRAVGQSATQQRSVVDAEERPA